MIPFACMPSPIPGRSDGICSLVRFHPLRPSHEPGRVGSCVSLFEACSAFTHVMACTLAKSPSDSLHQRLQQFRCLHYCSDCYRVERTSSRAGLTPAVDHCLCTAHPVSRLTGTAKSVVSTTIYCSCVAASLSTCIQLVQKFSSTRQHYSAQPSLE